MSSESVLERDLARTTRERDEARRDLGEILAVIHRDGGHHAGEHGLSQSVRDAHEAWAAVILERDEARAEVERLRGIVERMKAEEEQGVRDYLDLRDIADRAISERDRAQKTCNAYWHDLSRIAGLCDQTDDEYPLKAVERRAREYREARDVFVRVADALGLVGTDDTGRIGAIASAEHVIAQARLAARSLAREQPEPEEEER